ncbi:MAG TPA: cell division protein DamX, partial [Gammaproteobacteria bacterium]|nr:cell division protein DamX [Gammaproteobacteria bacterium]
MTPEYSGVFGRRYGPSAAPRQQARTDLPEYPGKQNAFIKRGNQILSEMSKAQN